MVSSKRGSKSSWRKGGDRLSDFCTTFDQTRDEKVYRVTTNDFLAGGQDEWVTFADGTNRENTYVDMQEVVNDYIGAHSPIAPAVEGRITKVAVPAELPVSGVAIPMEQVASVTILLGATLIVVGVYVRRRERNKVA
jgi:hypothetical protein